MSTLIHKANVMHVRMDDAILQQTKQEGFADKRKGFRGNSLQDKRKGFGARGERAFWIEGTWSMVPGGLGTIVHGPGVQNSRRPLAPKPGSQRDGFTHIQPTENTP